MRSSTGTSSARATPREPGAGREFFRWFTENFGSHPNFIYEVANEPNGVTWARIRSYADEIIPVVRAGAPDSVIVVGTRGWSSFGVADGGGPQEVIDNPVNASNVMYTFHFFAASHGSHYRAALETAANSLPVFVTEWGTPTFIGDGPHNFASAQAYVDLMAQKKISWTAWNYSDNPASSSAFTAGTCPEGPWTGSHLTTSGNWIMDRIKIRPTTSETLPAAHASRRLSTGAAAQLHHQGPGPGPGGDAAAARGVAALGKAEHLGVAQAGGVAEGRATEVSVAAQPRRRPPGG